MNVFTNVYRDLFLLHDRRRKMEASFVKKSSIVLKEEEPITQMSCLFVVPKEPIFPTNEEYLFINIYNF